MFQVEQALIASMHQAAAAAEAATQAYLVAAAAVAG